MSHSATPGASRDRRPVIALVLLGVVALIFAVGTAWWMTQAGSSDTRRPIWTVDASSSPAVSFSEQLDQLKKLDAEVVKLDRDINRYDQLADDHPHDDKPVNDLDTAQKKCEQKAAAYEQLAATVPADVLHDAQMTPYIGGLNSTADCAVDSQDEQKATPPPSPSPTS